MLRVTPGILSSEFRVAVLIATLLGVNSDQHWISAIYALIVASPGLAYIVSRGLAKVEPRGPASGGPTSGPSA